MNLRQIKLTRFVCNSLNNLAEIFMTKFANLLAVDMFEFWSFTSSLWQAANLNCAPFLNRSQNEILHQDKTVVSVLCQECILYTVEESGAEWAT